MAAAELTNLEVFWLGLVGGLVALGVTMVLPWALELTRSGKGPTLTGWHLIGGMLVFLIFAAAGGGAAVLMGDVTQAKTAVAYGLAWESILGGVVKSGVVRLPTNGKK